MNNEWVHEAVAEDDAGIWLSLGDLMSGLLLVFVLLFIVAILELQHFIEQSENRRVMIIQSLKEQLQAKDIDATLDEKTGDITITNKLLFDHEAFALRPDGKEFLARFVPAYSEVIFSSPEIEREVVRVIIEGHTSSSGDADANMLLSVRRSHAVTSHIMHEDLAFAQKTAFLNKVLTAGRGELEASDTDNPEDRRVKFRFKFRGDQFESWARGVDDP